MSRPSVTASVITLGFPNSIGALNPLLGEIAAIIELLVVLAIVSAVLSRKTDLNDRAFRLLRWICNRPEPPAPTPASSAPRGDGASEA
jgi:hypothetical protein